MKTEIEKTVLGFHCDMYRVVHHARYLEFLEEGRWHYCGENGLLEHFTTRGIVHYLVELKVSYRKSCRFGDRLSIHTGIESSEGKDIVFRQEILRGNDTVLEASLTNVFMVERGKRILTAVEMAHFWPDLAGKQDCHKET